MKRTTSLLLLAISLVVAISQAAPVIKKWTLHRRLPRDAGTVEAISAAAKAGSRAAKVSEVELKEALKPDVVIHDGVAKTKQLLADSAVTTAAASVKKIAHDLVKPGAAVATEEEVQPEEETELVVDKSPRKHPGFFRRVCSYIWSWVPTFGLVGLILFIIAVCCCCVCICLPICMAVRIVNRVSTIINVATDLKTGVVKLTAPLQGKSLLLQGKGNGKVQVAAVGNVPPPAQSKFSALSSNKAPSQPAAPAATAAPAVPANGAAPQPSLSRSLAMQMLTSITWEQWTQIILWAVNAYSERRDAQRVAAEEKRLKEEQQSTASLPTQSSTTPATTTPAPTQTSTSTQQPPKQP